MVRSSVDPRVVGREHRPRSDRLHAGTHRGGRRAEHLGHTGPQLPGRTERGDRGELVGGGRQLQLDLAECGVERNAGGGERTQHGGARGEHGAEHLGLRRPGVVEPGAVDRSDAHVRMAHGHLGGERTEALEVGADVGNSTGEVAAERVGAERATHLGQVDAGSGPHLEEAAGRSLPVAARAQRDGREVEQHAVEQRGEPGGVGVGFGAQVEQHCTGALLQLLQRQLGVAVGVHLLADLPVALAHVDGRRHGVAGDVQRIDDDAVGGGRGEPGDRRRGVERTGLVQRLGHLGAPLLVGGCGELAGEREGSGGVVDRHVPRA